MKVKDIIEELKKYDPKSECFLEVKISKNFIGADSILLEISKIYKHEYSPDKIRKHEIVLLYHEG